MILIYFLALHLLALVNLLVLVAVKTLNAEAEINSLMNGNLNIQWCLEQRRLMLGEKKGRELTGTYDK